jgi:hypothetical protein
MKLDSLFSEGLRLRKSDFAVRDYDLYQPFEWKNYIIPSSSVHSGTPRGPGGQQEFVNQGQP